MGSFQKTRVCCSDMGQKGMNGDVINSIHGELPENHGEVRRQVEDWKGDSCLQKIFRFHVFSWIPREAALGRQSLYPWLDWRRLKDLKISIAGMPPPPVLPDFSEPSTD